VVLSGAKDHTIGEAQAIRVKDKAPWSECEV
jgi:hypothetical protein